MIDHNQTQYGMQNLKTASASDWKTRFKSAIQITFHEARYIAKVTFRHIQHSRTSLWLVVKHQLCLWQLHCQKSVVGKQMHEDGLGDGRLLEQISELDRLIEQLQADKKPLRQAVRYRRTLVVQLADTVPESFAGGVTVEMKKLQSLETQISELEEIRRHHREKTSQARNKWTRISIGYGAILLVLTVGFGWLMSGTTLYTIAKSKESEVQHTDAGGIAVSEGLSNTDEVADRVKLINNKSVPAVPNKLGHTLEKNVDAKPNVSTDDDPPRPLPTYNDSKSDSSLYTPVVISRPHGRNHLVTTVKMPLDTELFVTLSFYVIHPDEPNVQPPPDGVAVAGVVMLENLVNVRDHKLTRRTRLRITRGMLPAFEVESPQEDWVNDQLKALNYERYSPLNLLFYLRGEGRIIFEVDGVHYPLSIAWRNHLMETLEETLIQRRRMEF